VEPLPHDLAVIAALETIGRPVGFAEAPPGALAALLNGTGPDFLVLYAIGGGQRDGSLSDPYADFRPVYQITIIGRRPEGVRWLAGKLEPALLGITVADRVVSLVIPEDLEGVYADRDVGPPHPYYSTPRFRLLTTPA
jgi:hypothetical protein